MSRTLRFEALLTDDGWLEPAYVALDRNGALLSLSCRPPARGAGPAEITSYENVGGFALPGYPNAHSHAFQYAMAGSAEHLPPDAAGDDFWSWREAMYRLALSLSADEIETIATMLYAEMLRQGYTAVAEFHYLHHDPAGKHYADPAEIGGRLVAAAETAKIRLTLVPIFYQRGGFGREADPRQRRFLSASVDEYQRLLEASEAAVRRSPRATLGVGVHSLRAVDPESAVTLLEEADPKLPRHLHIAEQQREVDECLAALGARPVEWLSARLALDDRYHLVHATHIDADESATLARSKANVVLCPTTEGNLGDGFFPLRPFLEQGGRFSIGSDSQIGLAPNEELRLLDYGQRLRSERRNVVCLQGGDDSGARLFAQALHNGRRAMGLDSKAFFEVGAPFDALVYDTDFPPLALARRERRLSTIVYCCDASALVGTIVGGRFVVRDGHHIEGERLRERYRRLAARR